MALDDHEQKILAEIERQFYEEDPELARAVRQIAKPSRVGVRLAMLGVVAGLAIVIAFFASNTVVAFLGFGLLVGSAERVDGGITRAKSLAFMCLLIQRGTWPYYA